jgi:hypothetical protein
MNHQDKLGTLATLVGRDSNGNYYVQYHSTRVVEWNDDQITLATDGWYTPTTALRMNQASRQFDLGFTVHRHAGSFVLQLQNDDPPITFIDSITFSRSK